MPSDLTISDRTCVPCTSCYKVAVVLSSLSLLALGILMLAKVKVFPESVFQGNARLEIAVKWSSLALSVILGMSGSSILCSDNEKSAPNSSTIDTSKQNSLQDDLQTSIQNLHALGKDEMVNILRSYCKRKCWDDFYTVIVHVAEDRAPDFKNKIFSSIHSELTLFLNYLNDNDTDKLCTILLAMRETAVLPKVNNNHLGKAITILLDKAKIQEAMTLTDALAYDKGIPYAIRAIQYCLDHTLSFPRPDLKDYTSWDKLMGSCCTKMLRDFFINPDYLKMEQMLTLLCWNKDAANFEDFMNSYSSVPPEKQDGLFFLRILAYYTVCTNKDLSKGDKNMQRLVPLWSSSGIDEICNAIDSCLDTQNIKDKMRELILL